MIFISNRFLIEKLCRWLEMKKKEKWMNGSDWQTAATTAIGNTATTNPTALLNSVKASIHYSNQSFSASIHFFAVVVSFRFHFNCKHANHFYDGNAIVNPNYSVFYILQFWLFEWVSEWDHNENCMFVVTNW